METIRAEFQPDVMMATYNYIRHSTVWAVVKWEDLTAGRRRGTIIETYDLKQDARRRVYELNGWRWKG